MKQRRRKERILVVDDDASVVDYLVEMLGERGYAVSGACSGAEALARVEAADYDLIVSDVEMPGLRGIDLLRELRERRPAQLVLLITAFGSIEMALSAVRAGACDFVTKPFLIETLEHAIERALRERSLRREIVRLRRSLPGEGDVAMEARSPAMRRVLELARRAAGTDATVLITGESGTGKGHLARYIHAASGRAKGPFVPINCATLPAPLVESELFGVRRGAFTDAREDRPGLLAQAHGGTVFLDEVGELPLEVQPKLLSVLESRRLRPVGGDEEQEVDLRIVAATNQPLEEALKQRRFRPDLYYRINVIRAEIPPLRERPEDLELLIDVLLQRACERTGRTVLGVSQEALRWLLSRPWPGNVRELANTIERAVALTDHDTILFEDLSPLATPAGEEPLVEEALQRRFSLEELERQYIQRVLAHTAGNKSRAARLLGIDRRTLYRKLGEEEGATTQRP